jgi:hypothetical protein
MVTSELIVRQLALVEHSCSRTLTYDRESSSDDWQGKHAISRDCNSLNLPGNDRLPITLRLYAQACGFVSAQW